MSRHTKEPRMVDTEAVGYDPSLELKTSAQLSPTQMRFIELFTGRKAEAGFDGLGYLIKDFRRLLTAQRSSYHDELLHPELGKNQELFERLLQLMCSVMVINRQSIGICIQKLKHRLVDDRVLQMSKDPEVEMKQQHLLFSVLGWLTRLYTPAPTPEPGHLSIITNGAKYPARTTADITKVHRPIDELFRAFGESLPQRNTDRKDDIHLKFHVSCMNVATLTSLAKVQLIWVDTISAHLDFDPTIPALYLFRTPSFCHSQSSQDATLPLLTREFYKASNQASGDSAIPSLMQEIILSYGLFFRDDRRSRLLYQSAERKRASSYNSEASYVDPLLDSLCGFDQPTSIFFLAKPGRETYHPTSDFPILKERLLKIHHYINGIEPGRISTLWQDRRDLRLWYTIWAVLIIGGITIIQSFISIFLSATQIAIAQEAFQLQKAQSLK